MIVVYGNRSEPTLHAIAGELAQVETLKLKLSLLMQSITPDGSTDKVMFGASSGGWAASAPIHFGVGFNRKASEKRYERTTRHVNDTLEPRARCYSACLNRAARQTFVVSLTTPNTLPL